MSVIEAWHGDARVELVDLAHIRPHDLRDVTPELDELRRLLFPSVTLDSLLENQLQDLMVLSTAVERRIEFLLSEAQTFHRCEDEIVERYEVHVIRPEDFVALFQVTE